MPARLLRYMTISATVGETPAGASAGEHRRGDDRALCQSNRDGWMIRAGTFGGMRRLEDVVRRLPGGLVAGGGITQFG